MSRDPQPVHKASGVQRSPAEHLGRKNSGQVATPRFRRGETPNRQGSQPKHPGTKKGQLGRPPASGNVWRLSDVLSLRADLDRLLDTPMSPAERERVLDQMGARARGLLLALLAEQSDIAAVADDAAAFLAGRE